MNQVRFIGREKELNVLNRIYSTEKFEFAVIYGRRRVGKTTLINEFAKDKKTIYFTGIESSFKQNLENFSKSVMECLFGQNVNTTFNSFQDAFEYVFVKSQTEKLILVVDEYPYVAHTDSSFASTLQYLIDKYKATSSLKLILCGSSMSYMEDEVLAYKSPLYGRRTVQLKILPFDFFDAGKYFPKYSAQDKALVYGLLGGTPQYLSQFDENLTIEDNIKNTYLNPSSYLFEEPENLLNREVRDPALYNAIISAIATGSSRLVEIANKVGENTSICTAYLKNLIALGLIKKEYPYGEESSRKSVYTIEDNMFRFWYRFIPENRSIISKGATDLAYKNIESAISHYMGKIFEEICTQYLWRLLLEGKSPVNFLSLGRWWGTDPSNRSQVEIDIMGREDKDKILLAECKWTNEKVDLGVLEHLILKSKLFSCLHVHLFVFAKNGFTQGCSEKAKQMENVSLVTFSELADAFK